MTPAEQARVEELERGLAPFDDPSWRADLALLRSTVQVAALSFLADCEAIVALAERVPRSPGDERGGTPWTSFVREVAVAQRTSDRAAHAAVALARRLLAEHPATVRALKAGTAPAHRARLLVELCAGTSDEVTAVADRLLADRLAFLPPWRLRQEVDLLVLRLDPDAAARQEAAATADRSASLIALPHAQAEVAVTGPAPLVQRWWDALTVQARALKAAGDPRSIAALRFDLAVHSDPRGLSGHDGLSAAVGIPEPRPARPAASAASVGPSAAPARGLAVPVRDDARCSRPVQVTVTVPATTALGLDDEPGWLEGHGWLSAPLSRRLLAVAELRKACVAQDTGRLVDLSDRVERPQMTPTALREAVRRMVLTPHDLRPTVTDPQAEHDPSLALRAFVHARDRWCDGPTGSRVPARRTDTDHERPWPSGPTAAHNLVSRSARTHQLKHAGWTPVRGPDGTVWTSPAGQVALSPSHDRPPRAPGGLLPDPDALASRDAALVLSGQPPDDVPVARRGSGSEQGQSPPDGCPAARGWPDEPPF